VRQVFLDQGLVVVKQVSEPLLDDHSVLISVRYSCISACTDLAANAQRNLFDNVPLKIKKLLESVATPNADTTTAMVKGRMHNDLQMLGCSCSGVVLATGPKVKRVRLGDYVACTGIGFANHADIVCVPENLTVRIHEHHNMRHASMATVGAMALQGLRRAHIQLGEFVCVLGLGLIGQLTAQLAKQAGCVVIAADESAERRAIAQACGITTVVPLGDDFATHLAYATNNHGVDATITTLPSERGELLEAAVTITRNNGRIVLLGNTTLHTEQIFLRDKELAVYTCSYGPGNNDYQQERAGTDYPYDEVRWTENRNMQAFVDLIERGQLKLDPLIAHDITIDDIEQAYTSIQKEKALCMIVTYDQHDRGQIVHQYVPAQLFPAEVRFVPAKKDTLRIGLVGVGEFARIRLLPIIAGIERTIINAVVDANVANAISVSRQYGAAHALVDDGELFRNDLADLVVIASPHKYHCDQALRALCNGKAVFLEKPLVTDFDQLERMMAFLRVYPHAPLCIDYNRSFSPFMQKIKKAVTGRTTPLVISYRMNVGFLPKEHWVHTDIGAGRIIGEACYVLDLFCYLTESRPLSVSVEAMHTDNPALFPTDNFIAQIRFQDGSLCSLIYTAIGHNKLGKERMELFYDSKAIIMDDYEYLAGKGFRRSFDETVAVPDEGHRTLITTFFESVAKGSYKPLISLDRLYDVALLTLTIDRLACQGGGGQELPS